MTAVFEPMRACSVLQTNARSGPGTLVHIVAVAAAGAGIYWACVNLVRIPPEQSSPTHWDTIDAPTGTADSAVAFRAVTVGEVGALLGFAGLTVEAIHTRDDGREILARASGIYRDICASMDGLAMTRGLSVISLSFVRSRREPEVEVVFTLRSTEDPRPWSDGR